MDNYPSGIRDFDDDPRSPFYDPPCCNECGEELEGEKCPVCDCDEEDLERTFNMPTKTELTGRRRHRLLKRWFRPPVLVLQLEVKGYVPENSGGRVDGSICKWWIDAKPEYITVTYR